jgi:hypothetical protein
MTRVLEADYGIPHCKFERNGDGSFSVEFWRAPVWSYALIPAVCIIALIVAGSAAARGGGFMGFLTVLGVCGAGIYFGLRAVVPVIKIIVSPDTVTINGKAYSRAGFGSFVQYGSSNIKSGKNTVTLHKLGFQFGNRSFPCGGAWGSERNLMEFTSSLNSHLQTAPRRGDEGRMSATDLREDRPTDF